jgi:FixJ family two-component response regulator
MMSSPPKVYVVDDDAAVRDGLVLLLESAGFVIDVYASASEFLKAAHAIPRSACLLLDVRMPDMSGPMLQAELARRGIDLPIIFLSAHGDIPTAVQAIKAGAADSLTKPVDGDLLIQRVQAALAMSSADPRRGAANRSRCAGLTAREREVMRLAVMGHTNKEIAQRLGISHRTVEIHRARVMRKTGVANLVELVHLAKDCASELEQAGA